VTETVRELARRSQAAAGAKDREAWLGLFADDAVEDPVGPSMLDPAGNGHRGADAIAAFYDAVIGRVDRLRFEIERSYVCGDEIADVGAIHMDFPGGSTAVVRGVFTYRSDGSGRLIALRAFWEFDAVEFA
jgi:ketosteroid isomerase-like protein